jgi:p-hydroxybenzoate 3-monooxygenase
MKTQVAIIGAGPSGLLLGQLLHRAGIKPLFSSGKRRNMCWGASGRGFWKAVPSICCEAGAAQRMDAEGLVHHGVEFLFEGSAYRLR